MKIYTEKKLKDFEFWGGAEQKARYLTWEEFETIENILDDINPNGMDETEVNDLFWFDDDVIAEWLGYENFEEIMERED